MIDCGGDGLVELRVAYEQTGFTIHELAEVTGRAPKTIRKLLAALGAEIRTPGQRSTAQEAVITYASARSVRRASREFGVPESTIRGWLKRANIPATPRPPASPRKATAPGGPGVREAMLEAAREYEQLHAHLRPSRSYETTEGLRLGEFLQNQRADARLAERSGRSTARYQDLDQISPTWRTPIKARPAGPRPARGDYLAAAKHHWEKHGTLAVPRRYKTADGLALGQFLYDQRRAERGASRRPLTAKQIRELDEIGAWRVFTAPAQEVRAASRGQAPTRARTPTVSPQRSPPVAATTASTVAG